MKYINTFNDGDTITGIYLCRQRNTAVTKNGKEYENIELADKSGTIQGKIWEPTSMGIGDFSSYDYIEIHGRVSLFNNALQIAVDKAFKASEGSFDPADYVPVTPFDRDALWNKVLSYIDSVKTPCYNALLKKIFVEDAEISEAFRKHSAAKQVHHGFIGGLMHHTVMVCNICHFLSLQYPKLNRDLLITAALLHDIGKTRELSDFPRNDYTDEGQLVGHIIIGTAIIYEKSKEVPDFPVIKKNELVHCILAHHGAYEYGSPKLPALMEAIALTHADNTDAKLEIMNELFEANDSKAEEWLGFNKFLDSNIRKTSK